MVIVVYGSGLAPQWDGEEPAVSAQISLTARAPRLGRMTVAVVLVAVLASCSMPDARDHDSCAYEPITADWETGPSVA